MPTVKRTYQIDGQKVRDFRKRLGARQVPFAQQVGITHSYLSEIETGKKQPSDRVAVAIARGLGVDVWDLAKAEVIRYWNP